MAHRETIEVEVLKCRKRFRNYPELAIRHCNEDNVRNRGDIRNRICAQRARDPSSQPAGGRSTFPHNRNDRVSGTTEQDSKRRPYFAGADDTDTVRTSGRIHLVYTWRRGR